VPILVFALTNSVNAQSVGLNIGDYHSINPATYDSPWEFNLDQKLCYSVDLYFRSILNGQRKSRLGVRVSFLSATKKWINLSEVNQADEAGYRYRMTTFLITYQRRIYHKRLFYLMFNFSTGISYRSFKNLSGYSYCDAPFCNLPHTSLSFQPGFDCIFRIYKDFALQINGRYNLLTTDKKKFYPFSSGYLFEVGLLIEMPKVSS
jgi:hypothetical protein